MADEDLIQKAVEGIRRLEYRNVEHRDGVEGTDLANDLGLSEELHSVLWHALKVAEERGQIEVLDWPGGMDLPEGITRS